jgi:predicted RNase H-like nuclease (RuvC/YqgF family)
MEINYKLALKRIGILAIAGLLHFYILRDCNNKKHFEKTDNINVKQVNYDSLNNLKDSLENIIYSTEQRLLIERETNPNKKEINYLERKLKRDNKELNLINNILNEY